MGNHAGQVVLALLGCGLCGGCSALPRRAYEAPALVLPGHWQGAMTGTGIASRESWWKRFNDPLLDQVIDRALRSNNDLAAAALKVRIARLTAGLTDTNLTPAGTLGASSSVSRDLRTQADTPTHQVTGTLSYELDLWGRLAGARDIGHWEAQATEADRQSAALSLIGTTAGAYWQVAYCRELIASTEASLAYHEKTLALVEAKGREGAGSRLDRLQAMRTLATQRATLPPLLHQEAQARNALAILLNQPPAALVSARTTLPTGALPAVEAGLPASLLGQRPDLRAAELRLRESWATIEATRASFYPAFTLTGSLGGASSSLKEVLTNPIGTLGVGLALPFLQWNTARLTVRISQAQHEKAVVQFRQTLLTALGEVENALSARQQFEAEGLQLQEALSLAREGETLGELRYRAGATPLQTWLDLQEARRAAEAALLGNRLNRLTNLMTLYQALGGN